MTDPLIRAIQLIGSLYAYALVAAAVVTYMTLWPFDRHLRTAR
jgi:hypothetical protein